MNIISTAWRQAVAAALAATMLASAFGPAAPVGAAESPDHRARLELVVKEVNIRDDREPWIAGDGEMLLRAAIWRCKVDASGACVGTTRLTGAGTFFSAGEADTVTLNLEVPGSGNVTPGQGVSRELGFPVYPDHRYTVEIEMVETDGGYCDFEYCDHENDHMGYVRHVLDDGENGLGVGTHTLLSKRDDGSDGDYVVTYEIRRVPLPDLAPVSIRVYELPGSAKKRVCMTVVNSGNVHAGPFRVNVDVNGQVPPDGIYTVGVVGAGMDYLVCVETTLPTSGDVKILAVVDKPRAVVEYNELNNVHEQTFTFSSSPSAPSSSSTNQGQGQPDLVVSAIRVRGQVPDGKDDCKDGKNAVTVVVKNAGTGKADGFAVRLDADGDEVSVESVDGLEAGQEREVKFEDVRLKKGEHTLAATVDPKKTVGESNEENNQRQVTARCQGDA